jgi:hypothetical protein
MTKKRAEPRTAIAFDIAWSKTQREYPNGSDLHG